MKNWLHECGQLINNSEVTEYGTSMCHNNGPNAWRWQNRHPWNVWWPLLWCGRTDGIFNFASLFWRNSWMCCRCFVDEYEPKDWPCQTDSTCNGKCFFLMFKIFSTTSSVRHIARRPSLGKIKKSRPYEVSFENHDSAIVFKYRFTIFNIFQTKKKITKIGWNLLELKKLCQVVRLRRLGSMCSNVRIRDPISKNLFFLDWCSY